MGTMYTVSYLADKVHPFEYQAILPIASKWHLQEMLWHVVDDFARNHPIPHGIAYNLVVHQLGGKFGILEEFFEGTAHCNGIDPADPAVMTPVWGTIRLFLVYAAQDRTVLTGLKEQMKELVDVLPRLGDNDPLSAVCHSADENLRIRLQYVYEKVMLLFLHMVDFFRGIPFPNTEVALSEFKMSISGTLEHIKNKTTVIYRLFESRALVSDMHDRAACQEVIELLDTQLGLPTVTTPSHVRYNNLPFAPNPRFIGREAVLHRLDTGLAPTEIGPHVKSMTLLGESGVGKTQIAMQYAHRSLSQNKFELIIWVAANNTVTIAQSFRTVAGGLLQMSADQLEDGAIAIYKVKKWLAATSSPVLYVFDGVEDVDVMKVAWPKGPRCSILITTHLRAVAEARLPVTQGILEIKKMRDEDGSKMLLRSLGLAVPSPDDQEKALAISETFGRLPLPLTQIGNYIKRSGMSLSDFLLTCQVHSLQLDAQGVGELDHTKALSMVWDISLGSLTNSSMVLFNLLLFLDPNGISADIFLQGSEGIHSEFAWLADESRVRHALEELIQAELISRAHDSPMFSMHRLVRSAGQKRLTEAESVKYLDLVVHLLCWGFPVPPDTEIYPPTSSAGSDKCFPHVHNLVLLVNAGVKYPTNHRSYADLLLRCARYLRGREMYLLAKDMAEQATSKGLSAFDDETGLDFANAIEVRGLIDQDLRSPCSGREDLERVVRIRKAKLEADEPYHPLLADAYENEGVAHLEKNGIGGKFDAHLASNSFLAARACRAGGGDTIRLSGAIINLVTLSLRKLLWKLGWEFFHSWLDNENIPADTFTDQTLLNAEDPRFADATYCVAHLHALEGRNYESLMLLCKVYLLCRNLPGHRIKTANVLYPVAGMLYREGFRYWPMKIMEEIVLITEAHLEGRGQRARAMFKLSGMYHERGMADKANSCAEEALRLRQALRPDLQNWEFGESSFRLLVGFKP